MSVLFFLFTLFEISLLLTDPGLSSNTRYSGSHRDDRYHDMPNYQQTSRDDHYAHSGGDGGGGGTGYRDMRDGGNGGNGTSRYRDDGGYGRSGEYTGGEGGGGYGRERSYPKSGRGAGGGREGYRDGY